MIDPITYECKRLLHPDYDHKCCYPIRHCCSYPACVRCPRIRHDLNVPDQTQGRKYPRFSPQRRATSIQPADKRPTHHRHPSYHRRLSPILHHGTSPPDLRLLCLSLNHQRGGYLLHLYLIFKKKNSCDGADNLDASLQNKAYFALLYVSLASQRYHFCLILDFFVCMGVCVCVCVFVCAFSCRFYLSSFGNMFIISKQYRSVIFRMVSIYSFILLIHDDFWNICTFAS